MKLETGNWTIGRMMAFAMWAGMLLWMGGCAVLASLGCRGGIPESREARDFAPGAQPWAGMTSGEYMEWCLANGIDVMTGKRVESTGPAAMAVDAVGMEAIESTKDSQEDWRKWPVTHSLKATLKGGKLTLDTDAVKAWPDGGGDVCANLHFLVQRQGKWLAYCFDYVRPGQTVKGDLPRAPCKAGESYETVAPGERCYLVLTGLCRDRRRNVSERTNIVRVQ